LSVHLAGSQLKGVFDVERGEFTLELLIALGVVDVLAQPQSLGGRDPATDIAAITP
jgi:hypothetical protein